MNETFYKAERLSSKSLITLLFTKGEKRFSHPFRIVFIKATLGTDYPVQLLISVPRSLYKKAVDRNRIKRLIREAYRKNKYILYQPLLEKQVELAISITYISKEIVSFKVMQEKIILLLQRLRDGNAEASR